MSRRPWSNAQVQQAANEVVLAVDGNIRRTDAVQVAKAMLRWFDLPGDRP